ncbi:MAG TPA: multicopper oxidase family protein [Methylomirabilota bacterium]|nr:multicopper oxidase family protein [Methylomirabilota bacterium]
MRKKKLLLVLLIAALLITISLRYFAYKSRLPDSMNMSSPIHMHNDVSLEGETPVASLRMNKTNASVKNFSLIAQVVKRKGLPDAWTFNGTTPGPELHVIQGDHVHVILVNRLPVATSIHWHGLSVPNAEDGVAGVTQDAVKPGESYAYDFIASDDPGTYWYHSHQDPNNQIPKGLFGAFIIDPVTKPHYDHDYVLAFANYQGPYKNIFESFWNNLLQNAREKQSVAINGNQGTTLLTGRPGEKIRLRLINATAGDFLGKPVRIAVSGAQFQVVALDGHDLHEPQFIKNQILPIDSGQRYDLVVIMPTSGAVQLLDLDDSDKLVLGSGKVAPDDPKTFSVFDFTNYGTSTTDPLLSRTKFDVNYTLEIGAHPGFHNGELAFVNTINGKSSPNVPMLTVKPDQVVHIHMVNKSIQAHPMHLHGHVMTILKMNVKPIKGSPVHLDSILLERNESVDVAFVANNPGLWMLHCHITNHAMHGLSMMVVYPNISTPYTIGIKSGNIPE